MNKLQTFAVWLDGFLEDEDTLNETKTAKLKDKLNGLFEHAAEELPLKFEGFNPDENFINSQHGPPNGPEGEELMRC